MGGARWSKADYTTYADTTQYRTASRAEVFSSRYVHETLNPAKIVIRESRDSEANPESTPIIIGLDVTGSMGFVAEEIAKNGLSTLMTEIYEAKPVTDPHVMFMAIGDIRSDRGPLQVSQFEADTRIIEQLRLLWLESGGGGNDTESYDLPWYFGAYKTVTDAMEKRQKRGYLFTIGDELAPNEALPESRLKELFGGQVQDAGTPHELLSKVTEKYQVFHIISEEGSCARRRLREVRESWVNLTGVNTLYMKNHKDLTSIILATMAIAEGADIEAVIQESQNAEVLRYAFQVALATGQ